MIKSYVSAIPEKGAGAKLTSLLSEYTDVPVLLLLSGGSSFSILNHVNTGMIGGNVTIGVLDERCSENEEINNFAQLKATIFFSLSMERGASAIDTSIPNKTSCITVAETWEDNLSKWLSSNTDGVVLATMGLGEDGHTAGIMPLVDVDFETTKVRSYQVPKDINMYTDRITLTYLFLREFVDYGIMFVKGIQKQKILRCVLDPGCDITETPGGIIHEMKKIEVFTNISLD